MGLVRMMPNSRFISSGLAAGVIGYFAWREYWLIALAISVPILVAVQGDRARAAGVAFSYYGAASWPVIEAHRSFVGNATPSAVSILLWMVAAILLAAPFTLAWTNHSRPLAWRIPLALISSAIPPLAIIGWASPLTAAGVLFPGTAWFGLALTALSPGLLLIPSARGRIAGTLAMVAAIAQVSFAPPVAPPNWSAVQTAFSPASRLNQAEAFLNFERIQSAVGHSKTPVAILPEAIIDRWNPATKAFWEPMLTKLAVDQKTAVIGVGIPIAGSAEFQNAAVIVGPRVPGAFVQRIPVPLGMWKPFGPADGVPLRLMGPGTLDIEGERVAFLICYEQLLGWPILHSAIEKPTVIVGMANQYWVRNTSVPAAQRASMKAWARLFGLPLLIAENR